MLLLFIVTLLFVFSFVCLFLFFLCVCVVVFCNKQCSSTTGIRDAYNQDSSVQSVSTSFLIQHLESVAEQADWPNLEGNLEVKFSDDMCLYFPGCYPNDTVVVGNPLAYSWYRADTNDSTSCTVNAVGTDLVITGCSKVVLH